jgi:hypothetical protein
MSWQPLSQRFDTLPLILAGPILRRTEPESVTVWLALKEARTVTLRIYAADESGQLLQKLEGTRRTIRLGNHLHIVAVTARATNADEVLAWGGLYYYDVFFQPLSENHVPAAHLGTPGVLVANPTQANALQRLIYPGHPLPGFVLPPEDLNQVRILHGSCRKPHGVGKEMLSAVDTLLEDSAQITVYRPQQLFLTGDQIYADDVAEPLLSMLIDAGEVLFAGNLEEILPLVNVPARFMPPGSRHDAVRNRAAFTTEEPENHLLSLREYACMYLFVWSDGLWPDELPLHVPYQTSSNAQLLTAQQQREIQRYLSGVKQVQEFRQTLPQVRRALANIATYMIADDHDVTDDWYLDGAWCRQVLNNALGQRILRNGLLAYALFQAWGNTPAQFDEPNGSVLLEAVDAWHGDEASSYAAAIAEYIGMPLPFEGSGQLVRSERALHWHYSLTCPRYRVIVLDTRTERIYPAPHAFPGLLSPDAIHAQVTEQAHGDKEVTLIVSSTPVLGVDLVEAIQFWSRIHSPQNYTYDPEAWALDRFTFQSFLKAISRMKRVVILSGDVHYAFGSSLDYWDYHTGETANIVDYTSSPLRNEGAGAQITALAMGYPHFFHRMKRHDIPSLDLFVWDVLKGDTSRIRNVFNLLRLRAYQLWWSIPKLIDIWQSPQEIVFPAQGWPKGAFNGFPPDRGYRLYYLPNVSYRPAIQQQQTITGQVQLIEPRPASQEKTQKLAQGFFQRTVALLQLAIKPVTQLWRELEQRFRFIVDAVAHREEWLKRRKMGMHIVGYANIGDISFVWSEREQDVLQRLWWWHPDHPESPTLGTEYRHTLRLPPFNEAPPLP